MIYCWGEAVANAIKQRCELHTSLEQSAEAAGPGPGCCGLWAQVLVAVGNGVFNLASAGNSCQEAVVTQPSRASQPAVTELPPCTGACVIVLTGCAAGLAARACGCWSGFAFGPRAKQCLLILNMGKKNRVTSVTPLWHASVGFRDTHPSQGDDLSRAPGHGVTRQSHAAVSQPARPELAVPGEGSRQLPAHHLPAGNGE